MSKLYINPYINFQGKAREGMLFYQKALGGKLDLIAFTEKGDPKPAGPKDTIMHARLESETAVIMGTDGSPEYPPTAGDNMAIALGGYDAKQLSKIFDELGKDGMIKMPLTKQSWGTFGWLQDKFGVNWMVNISEPES